VSTTRFGLLTLLLLLAAPAPAFGQEPRLAGRLAEPARSQVDAILVAARARGLPIEPLVDRALEGAAKGAPGNAVVAAVGRLRDELVLVREAFGDATTVAELSAGASAIRAGARPADLTRLRKLRPGQPVTVAAAVMADLVAAGVPADTAVGAVLALANNADDADYIAFRRNVQRDIMLGASPAAALAVRVRFAAEALDMGNAAPGTPGITKRKP
jgi:hypothetical protein